MGVVGAECGFVIGVLVLLEDLGSVGGRSSD